MTDKLIAATVKVLTAEVRILQVGSRQVTLSVYRQLDWANSDEIEPFGRVRDREDQKHKTPGEVFVVGVGQDGSLVRASLLPPKIMVDGTDLVEIPEWSQLTSGLVHDAESRHVVIVWDLKKVGRFRDYGRDARWRWREDAHDAFMARVVKQTAAYDEAEHRYQEWCALSLIVLAGLR